jgi:trypsin
MRKGVTIGAWIGVAIATLHAGDPLSAEPARRIRFEVTCGPSSCKVERAVPSGLIRLVVRLDHVPAIPPQLLSMRRGTVAMKRCTKEAHVYCTDADASEVSRILVDGHLISLTGSAPSVTESGIGAPLSSLATTTASGWDLVVLNQQPAQTLNVGSMRKTQGLDLGDRLKATALDSGGTPPVPTPKPQPAPRQPLVLPPPGGPTTTRSEPEYVPLPLDDESYPDLVAVGGVRAVTCTGVALSRRYVITAGHCGAVTRVIIATTVDAPVFETSVDLRIPAPDARVDLELLHTTRELPITSHARRHVGDHAPPDGTLRVLGFGISSFHDSAGFGVKRAFDIDAQGWGCDGSRPRTTGCNPDLELVLPATTGHDTCNGDSGGAVLELDETAAEWRLIAITVRAASNAATSCGQGGIYQRIDAVAAWIDGVVKGEP